MTISDPPRATQHLAFVYLSVTAVAASQRKSSHLLCEAKRFLLLGSWQSSTLKYNDDANSPWMRESTYTMELRFETEQGIVVSYLNFLAWKP